MDVPSALIDREPGAVATGLIVAIEASQEVIVDQPRTGGSRVSEPGSEHNPEFTPPKDPRVREVGERR